MDQPEPVPGRCNAKTRRKIGYCSNRPVNGSNRCRMHGGTSTGPKTSTVGFKYSKHAPQRWLPEYLEIVRSGEVNVALSDEIALIDAMIMEALGNFDIIQIEQRWGMVQGHFRRLTEAMRASDAEEVRASLNALENVLSASLENPLGQREVLLELFETKRRMSETEAKRLKNAHDSLSKRTALVFLAQIAQAVDACVRDDGDRQRLRATLAGMATPVTQRTA